MDREKIYDIVHNVIPVFVVVRCGITQYLCAIFFIQANLYIEMMKSLFSWHVVYNVFTGPIYWSSLVVRNIFLHGSGRINYIALIHIF